MKKEKNEFSLVVRASAGKSRPVQLLFSHHRSFIFNHAAEGRSKIELQIFLLVFVVVVVEYSETSI